MSRRLLRPLQLLVVLAGVTAAIVGVSPGSASMPSNPDGYFVVSDSAAKAAGTGSITWWSNSWNVDNPLSTGLAPSQFKGYAITFSGGNGPVCGGTWTTGPGNSPHPPESVSGSLRVIIAGNITATNDTIQGDIVGFGTVAADPGYGPSPGRRGTGTITANICNVE